MTKIDPGAIIVRQSPAFRDPVIVPINMYPVRIARAENDILFTEDGQRCIDMFSAHGTTWLGHGNRDITARIVEQLDKVWVTGGLETPVSIEAKVMVESFFPSSHELCGLYSTGMEAAEFAIRIARVVTKRNGVIGFEQSMHGKSLATAYLGWDNKDNLQLPDFYRIPFVQSCPEKEILRQLIAILESRPVSAVFVEPLQGIGGAYMASNAFYQEVSRLCLQNHVLLVFDEILTGFHKTGREFFFSELGFIPDIVLIGKALGNGFPVSGVVVNKKYPVQKAMLPGSTFSGNPLASAAVLATLRQMRSMDLPEKVASIEKTILENFGSLKEIGIACRGKGALWIVELPPGLNIDEIVANVYRRGVLVSHSSCHLRILPAATIEMSNLERACSVIKEELVRAST